MPAANNALTGMVKTHAHIRFIVIPQRTALKRLVTPAPAIEPAIVWVVLTGAPRFAAVKSVMAPAVSAHTPSSGVTLVIFVPMVLTMRHPPLIVPRPIEV